MLEWIVLSPVAASAFCARFSKKPEWAERAALLGAFGSLLFLAVAIATGIDRDQFGLLRLDALSLFFTAITAVVSTLVFAYSIGYMRREVEEGAVKPEQLYKYYAIMSLFLSAIYLATLAANLLIIWAAIEATTLTSVFLISFYNTRESIEAAWKYFIICSLGITVALVGLMILGYGVVQAGLPMDFSWGSLLLNAPNVDPLFLKIAFAFILVGYGTKLGMAPLHVWLPDAHSQAPTPVSALLSGVLLNMALYAILRILPLINTDADAASFASTAMLFFGLASLALASMRLYSQSNFKRLLAYSSTENMGIALIGLGIGGPLGIFAALLHVLSHSLVKPLAFFLGGAISLAYGTKEIQKITGAAQEFPFIGQMFLLSMIGLAGSLPFGIFFSEIALLTAALAAGQYGVAGAVILLTIVAFGSFLSKASGMAYGPAPSKTERHPIDKSSIAAIVMLFIIAAVVGMAAPFLLQDFIRSAASAALGGF